MKAVSDGIRRAEFKSLGVECQGQIQRPYLHFFQETAEQKAKKNIVHVFHNEKVLLFWASPSK